MHTQQSPDNLSLFPHIINESKVHIIIKGDIKEDTVLKYFENLVKKKRPEWSWTTVNVQLAKVSLKTWQRVKVFISVKLGKPQLSHHLSNIMSLNNSEFNRESGTLLFPRLLCKETDCDEKNLVQCQCPKHQYTGSTIRGYPEVILVQK